MRRSQALLLSKKYSSFSSSGCEDKFQRSDRSFSLDDLKLDDKSEETTIATTESIQGDEISIKESEVAVQRKAEEANSDLRILFEEIDIFITVLRNLGDDKSRPPDPPEIPDSVEKFVALVEKEIIEVEAGKTKRGNKRFLDAVDRLSKLTAAFTAVLSDASYRKAMNQARSVLDRAMSFLEDELYLLLDDSQEKQDSSGSSESKANQLPSSDQNDEPERCTISSSEPSITETASAYSPETIERLRSIANTMVSAGYETECCQAFSVSRRNAFDARLSGFGLAKASIDDIQKMEWEFLEGEIATWTKTVRNARTVYFARERELYSAVFTSRPDLGCGLFCNLARAIIVQLLNFAEAVSMTKRSAERLFKVLDMYETLRDVAPGLDRLFHAGELENGDDPTSPTVDIMSEISSTLSRLGEAAVTIFCDLERSIKADTGKSTVPGGAVHPLTRYVMNYLKYACEYKKTLEQVFEEHRKASEKPATANSSSTDNVEQSSAFATQVVAIMDLLQSNLEAKSKLYKDPALRDVFLMNNGRYIVQKIKSSEEIREALGETWSRRKSSELRQYHKNYQRETWGRVLACLRDEGLQANGRVAKPVLKERLKSFNAMFEEIHRAQSGWVVSDEQLQSELRVSVSAVVVPAYRSFLGRFQQHLDNGRHADKYIKFGPEDIQNYIDELFDGNPSSSMVRRKS